VLASSGSARFLELHTSSTCERKREKVDGNVCGTAHWISGVGEQLIRGDSRQPGLCSSLVSAGGDACAICRTGYIQSIVALNQYVVIWTPALPSRVKGPVFWKKGCGTAKLTQAKRIAFLPLPSRSLLSSSALDLFSINVPCHEAFTRHERSTSPSLSSRVCRSQMGAIQTVLPFPYVNPGLGCARQRDAWVRNTSHSALDRTVVRTPQPHYGTDSH
jgi:hypothetical protein